MRTEKRERNASLGKAWQQVSQTWPLDFVTSDIHLQSQILGKGQRLMDDKFKVKHIILHYKTSSGPPLHETLQIKQLIFILLLLIPILLLLSNNFAWLRLSWVVQRWSKALKRCTQIRYITVLLSCKNLTHHEFWYLMEAWLQLPVDTDQWGCLLLKYAWPESKWYHGYRELKRPHKNE